jgi:hypothetical protein
LNANLIGVLVGLIGTGIGTYIALYAMGFFQYLGGKKKHAPIAPAPRHLVRETERETFKIL